MKQQSNACKAAAVRCLCVDRNQNGFDRVNFPFTLAIASMLVAGVIGICCGLFLSNESQGVIGLVLTLSGTLLYSRSLFS